jgi:hypothetical protein
MRFLQVIILLALFLVSPALSFAQTAGISVSPSIIRVDLQTDGEEFRLLYKNTTSDPVQLSFKAQDFTELEEGWKVKFLEEKDAKNYFYSLSSWLEFERQTLELNPNEQRELKVRVKKNSLSPGGHYATVLAEITSNPNQKGQVTIKGILSSLVFIRANTGKEVEKAEVTSFNLAPNPLFSFPIKVVLRLNNIGNTELVPYGQVEIKDMFGNTATKGAINEDSLITLPQTVRRYDIALRQTGFFFFPGKYTASLTLDYGKDGQKLSRKIEFLSLGSLDWKTLLLLLIALILSLVALKRYKKSSTKKESKTLKI